MGLKNVLLYLCSSMAQMICIKQWVVGSGKLNQGAFDPESASSVSLQPTTGTASPINILFTSVVYYATGWGGTSRGYHEAGDDKTAPCQALPCSCALERSL